MEEMKDQVRIEKMGETKKRPSDKKKE